MRPDVTSRCTVSTLQDAFLDKHGVKLGFMSAFVKAATDALQVPETAGLLLMHLFSCTGLYVISWFCLCERIASSAQASNERRTSVTGFSLIGFLPCIKFAGSASCKRCH